MNIAERYRHFADFEAAGRSPLYAELAAGVSRDAEVQAWLEGLPKPKRQPNLLFAAYRLLAGTPSGWPDRPGAGWWRRPAWPVGRTSW